jgi:hypothetical protein
MTLRLEIWCLTKTFPLAQTADVTLSAMFSMKNVYLERIFLFPYFIPKIAYDAWRPCNCAWNEHANSFQNRINLGQIL